MPNAPNKFDVRRLLFAIIGLVEGVILVATPALVRDFSPQLGRASAMGFWTLGPVLGSLVVAVVSSNTLNHLPAWQDQFIIAGIVDARRRRDRAWSGCVNCRRSCATSSWCRCATAR